MLVQRSLHTSTTTRKEENVSAAAAVPAQDRIDAKSSSSIPFNSTGTPPDPLHFSAQTPAPTTKDQDEAIQHLLAAFGEDEILPRSSSSSDVKAARKKTSPRSSPSPEYGGKIEEFGVWKEWASDKRGGGGGGVDDMGREGEEGGLKVTSLPTADRSFKTPYSSDDARNASDGSDAMGERSTSSLSSGGASDSLGPSRDQQPSQIAQQGRDLALNLQTYLRDLSKSTSSRASSQTAALSTRTKELTKQLEHHFGLLGGKINGVTGYDEVERLKRGVKKQEESIALLREAASVAKTVYDQSVMERAAKQQETQRLLERKDSWTDSDVLRFTDLVKSGHAANLAVTNAKNNLAQAETAVDRAFDALLKSILERYHEEQVWSDKIRSVSTYGSLAVLLVNLIVFVAAIAFVEPWKRKRLVKGLEERVKGMVEDVEEGVKRELEEVKRMLAGMTIVQQTAPAPAPTPASSSEESASASEFSEKKRFEYRATVNKTPSASISLTTPNETSPTNPPISTTERALQATKLYSEIHAPAFTQYVPSDPQAVNVALASVGGMIIGGLIMTLTTAMRSR